MNRLSLTLDELIERLRRQVTPHPELVPIPVRNDPNEDPSRWYPSRQQVPS